VQLWKIQPGQAQLGRAVLILCFGGTAQDLRDYLGEEIDALPLRFNGDRPGLYAMGVSTSDGEVEIRRTAVSRFQE
jgi:hypothetical protein